MTNETVYQRKLIKNLEQMFPGCFIIKTDPSRHQGIPDLIVLWGNTWFSFEVKLEDGSPVQPNQEYYVNKFNEMSWAAFINPDIEEMVLNDLQFALGVTR